jgi:hypothetical protein
MNKQSKNTPIVLSVFHLPVLVAVLAVAGLGTGSFMLDKAAGHGPNALAAVLSEENDREDSKDKEHSTSDNNKDTERQNGSANVGGTKEKEDSEDEKDSGDVKDSEKNKVFEEDKEEPDDSEEIAEVSSVTNADGTVTKTFKITDDGEVETKIITYDANGKIIKRENLNEDGSEEHEEEVVVSVVTNDDGTTTKTIKKTEDGKVEIKALTYDQNGKLIKKAVLNEDGTVKEEEIIGGDDKQKDDSAENDKEFEVTFKLGDDGTADPALSGIIKAQLEQEIETEGSLGTEVNKVELQIKTAQGTVKYEGTASKDEKLFGLFGIEIPVDIEVDPITGKILAVNQSFWLKILDFFSF